jgi:hypothetical protein
LIRTRDVAKFHVDLIQGVQFLILTLCWTSGIDASVTVTHLSLSKYDEWLHWRRYYYFPLSHLFFPLLFLFFYSLYYSFPHLHTFVLISSLTSPPSSYCSCR